MLLTAATKRCTGCNTTLPIGQFYTRGRGNHRPRATCKSCWRAADALLKQETFAAYGGKCQCPYCDIDCIDFLTIDHIHGDGAASRRNGEGSGSSLWRYLKRNGFPKDRHRLLCFNCNCARRFGPCPHEKLFALRSAERSPSQLCFHF